ncbi:MAG: hypothetical protein V4640_12060 [Verrucomicrobiota bacterium]
MSWTESFPVMGEDMVDDYENLATPEEKAELEEWYGVKEIFNAQDKRHLVSFSLFWKPSSASKKVYPTPTREILQTAGELGLDLRFEPWPHYIQPVLDAMPVLMEKYDDVTVRVYLAADLDFLVEDFVNVGCEVYLMRHPSLAHAPGVVWRVLAFAEKDRLVTMVDSDRLNEVIADIERTREMDRAGLKSWRVPVMIDTDGAGKVVYKSFIGCQIGAEGGWPMERLLHAFTWHSRRGSLPTLVDVPGCGVMPINHGYWPDFGFEEWFLTVVMYPRMAGAGMLTFVPTGASSSLLLLDIEYATWANPNSQLVIFPTESCCGPVRSKLAGYPADDVVEFPKSDDYDSEKNGRAMLPPRVGENLSSES